MSTSSHDIAPQAVTSVEWERFVTGHAAFRVRPEILASWYRCRDYGVDPYAPEAPAAGDDRPGRCLDEDIALAELAAVARSLDPEAESLEAITAVADADGRILFSGGSTRTLRRGRSDTLAPAFAWAEETVGTNGIGLALHSEDVALVDRSEHWCAVFHDWSCAGLAVRDPVTHDPLGVLDICVHGRALPESVPAALRYATRGIQAAADDRAAACRHDLARVFTEHRRAHAGPVAVADKAGRLLMVNDEGRHLFGTPNSALLDPSPAEHVAPAIPQLTGVVLEAIGRGRHNRFWVGSATVYVPAQRRQTEVTVHPIRARASVVGALITTDGAEGERFDAVHDNRESAPERILGVHENCVVVLSPREIRFAEADGNTVWLDTDRGRLPACERGLARLQRRLEEHGFARVHRKFLVNLERVQEIAPNYHGGFWLRVDSPRHGLIPVSRRHVPEVRALLGL